MEEKAYEFLFLYIKITATCGFSLKNNLHRFNTNKAKMPTLCICLIIIIALN